VPRSPERIEIALELMQSGPVVIVQRQGSPSELSYLSGNFQAVLGLDPQPFLTGEQDLFERIHEGDRQALSQTGNFSGGFRLLDDQGRWRHVIHQTIVDQGGAGRPASSLAYWLDHTSDMENSLHLEMALEAARIGTWDWNRQTGRVSVDAQWARLIGRELTSFKNLTKETWRDLMHPADQASWDEMDQAVGVGDQVAFDLHLRFHHRSGRWVWCRVRGKVFETTTEGSPLRMLGTQEDITELIQAQDERSILSQVVEQGPSAVIITDLLGTIEYVNHQFTLLTGYSFEEVQGKNPRILKSSETSSEVYRELWSTLLSGRSWYGELQNQKRDGTPYWVQVSISPVSDSTGKVTRYVGQQVDATPRKLAEAQLRRAQKEAVAANQAKTDFLAHMSHEIRTPMNGILGLTDLVLERGLDPEVRGLVEYIRGSGQALLALVSDILDVSKIEAGKMELESTAFSLKGLIQATLVPLEVLAAKKGLTLNSRWPVPLSDHRNGDPTRLRQILTNLIGNAIKFTSQGSITITVDPDTEDPSANGVRISVQDTGLGVPEDLRHRLFQRYSQAEASTNRHYGGTGLGLAICRDLVERMGGRIGYTQASDPVGAVFWFSLPLMPAILGPAEADTRQKSPLESPRRDWKVLVVEDNPVNQQVAQGLLRRHGVVPVLASNGVEAINKLASGSFDLVLMDVQMPVMDGLEATRAIRAGRGGDQHRNVTIIAMTANAMGPDRDASLQSGMDDYLSKPISSAQFEALLYKWESLLRSRRTFDPVELRNRLQLEDSLLFTIIQLFLQDLPVRKNALLEALTAKQGMDVHRIAHTLRGTAANLVAQGVVEAAQALELSSSNENWDEIEPLYRSLLQEIGLLEEALVEFLH